MSIADAKVDRQLLTHIYTHSHTHITHTYSEGKLLQLKRGPTLKTCPNTWGALGEHQQPGETVVCMCMCIYVCMYVCMYALGEHQQPGETVVCMCVYMYACMHACMYVYVCMPLGDTNSQEKQWCVCVCMYVCVCVCMCV